MTTIRCKLIAEENDLGYITYIFQNLDAKDLYTKYLMCTQFPNWNHRKINVGEVGFCTYEEHVAGESKWFDGVNFNNYRYDGIQFIKFIDEKQPTNNNLTL